VPALIDSSSGGEALQALELAILWVAAVSTAAVAGYPLRVSDFRIFTISRS
jgi:hypothetical protein